MFYNLTEKKFIDFELNKPKFLNGTIRQFNDFDCNFNIIRINYSVVLVPCIVNSDYNYMWYINDKLYSENTTCCFITDSFNSKVELKIYKGATLLSSFVKTLSDTYFNDNFRDYSLKSFDNTHFNVLLDNDEYKYINIVGSSKLINNLNIITDCLKKIDLKKHYYKVEMPTSENPEQSSELEQEPFYYDFDLEKVSNNIYKVSNYKNDFGVCFGNLELWFNVKNRYKLFYINWLIRDDIIMDKSVLKTINNQNYFVDPINSIHLLNKGNSFSKNNLFNIYSYVEEIIEEKVVENNQSIYSIDNLQFNLEDESAIINSLQLDKTLWTHYGYVLHSSGLIEVCSPVKTSFRHKNRVFDNITSVIVNNPTNNCLIIEVLKDNTWKPVLVPPSQELKSIDFIKVSDKISLKDVSMVQIENENLIKFKNNHDLYYKPYVPGYITIKFLRTGKKTEGINKEFITDENIVLTTNEYFKTYKNPLFFKNTKDVVYYENKIYSLNDYDIFLNDKIDKITIKEPIDANKGITSLDESFHYEYNQIECMPISKDTVPVNSVKVSEIIKKAIMDSNMRLFDYNRIFKNDCVIHTLVPILKPYINYINCSYSIIFPHNNFKNSKQSGTYDIRYKVV